MAGPDIGFPRGRGTRTITSNTWRSAACTVRSRTVGMPNGRGSALPGLGIHVRRIAAGRYVPCRRSVESRSNRAFHRHGLSSLFLPALAPPELPGFFAPTPALTPVALLSRAGSPCFTPLSFQPFRRHLPLAPGCRFRTLPLSSSDSPISRVWASSVLRRLAAFQAVIAFAFLRTGRSPLDAPHPALPPRSFVRFRAGERMPGADFHRSAQVRSQAHGGSAASRSASLAGPARRSLLPAGFSLRSQAPQLALDAGGGPV